MNDIENLSELISLSEKVSDNISYMKRKQSYIVINFFILLIIVYIFGYIFSNISIVLNILFCVTVFTLIFIKSNEFSQSQKKIKSERTCLSTLLSMVHDYKTLIYQSNEISTIKKTIFDLKLARISYSV